MPKQKTQTTNLKICSTQKEATSQITELCRIAKINCNSEKHKNLELKLIYKLSCKFEKSSSQHFGSAKSLIANIKRELSIRRVEEANCTLYGCAEFIGQQRNDAEIQQQIALEL